jgi:GNAT superfamily N-acetyltransferase
MTLYPASSVSMAELASVFNQAFSDYLIEVYFTRDSLREYVHRHGLDLDASLVVGTEGFLVGLLLSGSDEGTTWNAGMGVHPDWRRRGLGTELLDEWLAGSRKAGLTRALLEVIKQNLVATNLYLSRGFREVRSYQGFEGRPGWPKMAPINPERVQRVGVGDLLPVYRKGHSWQKRPEVLERLGAFTAIRTVRGDGYLIYECVGGLMYIFDMTPNEEGRALLEHAVRREVPRLLRVVNAIDLVEEDLYRGLGFRPWIRNVEMVLNL